MSLEWATRQAIYF